MFVQRRIVLRLVPSAPGADRYQPGSSDWEDSTTKEGPRAALLDRLVKSGISVEREIGNSPEGDWRRFFNRSLGMSIRQIHDSIERLEKEMGEVKASQKRPVRPDSNSLARRVGSGRR